MQRGEAVPVSSYTIKICLNCQFQLLEVKQSHVFSIQKLHNRSQQSSQVQGETPFEIAKLTYETWLLGWALSGAYNMTYNYRNHGVYPLVIYSWFTHFFWFSIATVDGPARFDAPPKGWLKPYKYWDVYHLPTGKRLHNYGKSPFFMGNNNYFYGHFQ